MNGDDKVSKIFNEAEAEAAKYEEHEFNLHGHISSYLNSEENSKFLESIKMKCKEFKINSNSIEKIIGLFKNRTYERRNFISPASN